MPREVHDARPSARLPEVHLSDLEELADRGLLLLSAALGPNGQRGRFRLGDAGWGYVQRTRDSGGPEETDSSGVGLDWKADVAPVLHALYEVQSSLAPDAYGVSQDQINQRLGRLPDDPQTDRVLAQLEKADYLDDVLANDSRWGPISCRLSEKGLQETAGWPSPGGASAVEAFLASLDEKLDDPDISDEQRGWLLKMREAAGNISQSVISNLLAAYIKSQTGL